MFRVGQTGRPLQFQYEYFYAEPRVVAITGPMGLDIRYEYDGLYRLTARKLPTDPANHIERFTYDKAGNKLTETDANGHTAQLEYDRLNRLVRRTDPVGNVVELSYDAAGNIELEHDVTRGLRKETDYDFLNRPSDTARSLPLPPTPRSPSAISRRSSGRSTRVSGSIEGRSDLLESRGHHGEAKKRAA